MLPYRYSIMPLAFRIRDGGILMAAVLEAPKVLDPSTVQWNPHPKFKGVEVAYLLSKKDDAIDMTCILARWHVGAEIPKHIHEESDDILYILQGKAKIWIDGVGDVPLSAGSFVRVPKGVLHQPHDVEEEMILHDTWFPATV
jgi:mannose-6-phosphate isomerase-like protein (cupin superfamily)